MDAELLLRCGCYFGGGTAIVLQNGEYRLSKDLDFLCAEVDGYRELRTIAVTQAAQGFFGPRIQLLREFKVDQYGLRAVLSLNGQPIKFEIVRESRIRLAGAIDPDLGLPTLSVESQFAEKLLANADRCLDRSVAYRDAIDLGFLLSATDQIPAESITAAERAYGYHIRSQIASVFGALSSHVEVDRAVCTLEMDRYATMAALKRLRQASMVAWPDLQLAELPRYDSRTSYNA